MEKELAFLLKHTKLIHSFPFYKHIYTPTVSGKYSSYTEFKEEYTQLGGL